QMAIELHKGAAMKHRHISYHLLWLLLLFLTISNAQVTRADYERANGLREKYQWQTENVVTRNNWIGKRAHFWYMKSVKGGYEFVVVNAESLEKRPAFDHAKLAEALAAVLPPRPEKITALRLPINELTFVD